MAQYEISKIANNVFLIIYKNLENACYVNVYAPTTVLCSLLQLAHVGYEPADLTVHPPPRTAEGGFIFFV